ncbi:hypothetical protein HDV00_006945 [Rhizophlyctis rosea]|nr:hypothetical protein HDV00_006945 [Rhizophlyctis rosea]
MRRDEEEDELEREQEDVKEMGVELLEMGTLKGTEDLSGVELTLAIDALVARRERVGGTLSLEHVGRCVSWSFDAGKCWLKEGR